MNNVEPVYTSQDFAIVVPTYNRPQKVHKLLKSLTEQRVKPGRIIIVDGGESVKNIVTKKVAPYTIVAGVPVSKNFLCFSSGPHQRFNE